MDIYVKPCDWRKWVFEVFYRKTNVKIFEIRLSPGGWKTERELFLPDYLLTRPIKSRAIAKLCVRRGIKPMDLSLSLGKQIRHKARYLYHHFQKEMKKEEEERKREEDIEIENLLKLADLLKEE